ncbi:beta-glucuronidase [Povalibacter uvarum]|uniref:Beta-glucuronidase n=1 Tax=Povalibacter uvarum TaxID=732238 RepID=A0A841HP38_9GAMM|nr:beta-glucuronidase [Povalibacter uvarum]MBB6094099.1 beta-glucuronidase [Povalibacter uvarum]
MSNDFSIETQETSTADDGVTRRTFFGMAGGAVLVGAQATAAAQTAQRVQPSANPTLLYPHSSSTRATRDLSGVWKFRADPDGVGEKQGWMKGIGEHRAIPVPCSWNEIFDDLRNYTGGAWYQCDFEVDSCWKGRRLHLRFGSVAYRAKVWLNGELLGEHVGAHLPFAFDVTSHVRHDAENVLVLFVENELRLDRVPAVPDTTRVSLHTHHFPQTTYDFFPYAGIHRPVWLFTTPDVHVHDVTVKTDIDGKAGVVSVAIRASQGWSGNASVRLSGQGRNMEAKARIADGEGIATLRVPDARLWSTDDPHLYKLTVVLQDGDVRDEYSIRIGIREVRVDGEKLLVNGKPVYLRGFGKHEDFALNGRGLNVPSIIRDFELLRWLGANSFRTSHYPYSEEAMMLADEYGLLVIDETSAVSLVFMDGPVIQEARQRQLQQDIATLVARDKNHPCVIMWSVANEPLLKPFHTVDPTPQGAVAVGTKFFAPLFDLFRKLDPTRPVTLVSVQGGPSEWMALGDVICTNSYSGWYGISGRLDDAAKAVEQEALGLRQRHPGKPIIFSEFGADAMAGMHSQPADMWTEEYQAEMVAMYIETLARHPFVIGTHPWAFADFRTSQSIMRIGAMNLKGAFTRDRKPKLVAHRLRQMWKGK